MALSVDERDEALRLAGDELEDARQVGQARALGVALRTLGVLESNRDLLRQGSYRAGGVPGTSRERARADRARRSDAPSLRARLSGNLSASDWTSRSRAVPHAFPIASAPSWKASGARLRRERVTGRDALTPSELRVARLAAQGRTNNEIAQALFVTPKTIDTHLSRVYSKLGISSRRALAAALEEVVAREGATVQEPSAGMILAIPTRPGWRWTAIDS